MTSYNAFLYIIIDIFKSVIPRTSFLIVYVHIFSATEDEEKSLNFYTLLKDPGITLIYIHMFGASLALTYLDPIMSQWLQTNVSIQLIHSTGANAFITSIWKSFPLVCDNRIPSQDWLSGSAPHPTQPWV